MPLGQLALEDRLHNMTLTDIAVDMWNHAPRMVKPTPSLTQEEMRELLSFLWMRQFVYPTGSVANGKEIFKAVAAPIVTRAARTARRSSPARRGTTRKCRSSRRFGGTVRRC